MFEHFIAAQDRVWHEVVAELAAGRKTSHWMWFVFPQLAALGRSPMAKRFGLASLEEAQAYLRHPVLGTRLVEATRLVLEIEGASAHEIFWSPDDLKFRSSMTLFARADPAEPSFRAAIERHCGGTDDPLTLQHLAASR